MKSILFTYLFVQIISISSQKKHKKDNSFKVQRLTKTRNRIKQTSLMKIKTMENQSLISSKQSVQQNDQQTLGSDQSIKKFVRIGPCKRLQLALQRVQDGKLICIYTNQPDEIVSRDNQICTYYLSQLNQMNMMPYDCPADSSFGNKSENSVSITRANPGQNSIEIVLNELKSCPQKGFMCLKQPLKLIYNKKRLFKTKNLSITYQNKGKNK